MANKLTRGADADASASIQRHFSEDVDDEIGDLKAQRLLDLVLSEIAPTVYNRAISDADAYFQGKVEDIEGSCHEPGFSFWPGARSSNP